MVTILGYFLWYSFRSDSSGTGTAPYNNAAVPGILPTQEVTPRLSLEEIFASDHSWVTSLPKDKTVTLIATGDVIPARMTNFKAMVQYKNPRWAFEKTADFLRSGDITLIDLEAPLLSDCPATKEGMIFCGHRDFVNGLTFAGVDIASLANNHLGNHGDEGIRSTQAILQEANIASFGITNPTRMTVKGTRFAFLGYNDIPGSLPIPTEVDTARMAKEIAAAKVEADVVIVEFHWGVEYVTTPEPRLIELGHLAVDSGADLVIGNHPHWIKPIELYHGKLITYGHGNFIFDQEWSQKTKEGVVGSYVFYEGRLIDVQYFPIEIVDFGQPYFLEGLKKEKILTELFTASKILR